MEYLFENLGDERFQEFCSCIISKEFANIQALPVGQPDGGRDSIVYFMDSPKKDFIVFQVKFVRYPNQERDIVKWLIETIEKESEKIDKLITKGAKSYYLLTNVKGTAHLDTGSKDKINKILEENIKIPSLCWWSDDLSRLFEKDPLFKWSFPEILNGQDILNSALFNNLHENKERRENVIRAYLTEQFDLDNDVKFKQIDLQNRLLTLFTDVPLRIKKFNENNSNLKSILHSFDFKVKYRYREDSVSMDEKNYGGAAEFLLNPKVQSGIERILLEGGPGQGKSTISQYICQVHRARLLKKQSDLESLPDKIKNNPVRLPFKIDLRDLASWVEKKNPYQILSQEYFENTWKNSLESFLVAHIFYHSQLEEFTSNDFIAVCKLSPILLVFDGFDEIADIKLRSEVIEFINKGLNRISGNASSMQVIITSRPAAFSDSVGFAIDTYPHFELTDITLPIINEYVEKWIKASKLDIRDAKNLKKLIAEKIDLPHLKDLARSPMQLAILISLLRTKGQSLPNKRTALYDSYIELFFDRESEKDSLIREKRYLIIDIHQYLAWILHSEAELYKNSGSIDINTLNTRLKEYLASEGQDTSIADLLFNAVKERVCALVSRVQGTFEFEVQPLREYFCAQYLYKTAPHSSAGSVIKYGTKPDRFNTILRNQYWQNVVRFFAGCADVGELDMIIQELKDLQNDDILKYTNYPRIITSQILSDYVFTQKPLKLKEAVKIIVNGINIRNVINQEVIFSANEPLHLPNECGRFEIIEECFQQLLSFPNSDYSQELIGIINNNPLNTLETWLELSKRFKGQKLTKWLDYGYKLRIIHKIDAEILLNILKEGDALQTKERIELVINGNRLDIINSQNDLKDITYNAILNNELSVYQRKNFDLSLSFMLIIFRPYVFSFMLRNENSNITFINHLTEMSPYFKEDGSLLTDIKINDIIDQKVHDFAQSIKTLFNVSVVDFKTNIEPWNIFVENGRKIFNENWCLKIIATIAAGIKSKDDQIEEYYELSDQNQSLCRRVRYSRLKSGNIKYWEKQIQDSSDIQFTLLIFFTWATPKTILNLLSQISETVKQLSSQVFLELTNALHYTVITSSFDKGQQQFLDSELSKKKNIDEVKYILSLRFGSDSQKFVYENIRKNTDILKGIDETRFQYLVSSYLSDTSKSFLLDEIKKIYQKKQYYTERYLYRYSKYEPEQIPYELAQEIMRNCKDYPRLISSLAELSCRQYANKTIKPVGEIAKVNNWF